MRTVTQTVTVLWVCFQSIVCGKNSRDQELKLQILKNESLALSPLAQNYYGQMTEDELEVDSEMCGTAQIYGLQKKQAILPFEYNSKKFAGMTGYYANVWHKNRHQTKEYYPPFPTHNCVALISHKYKFIYIRIPKTGTKTTQQFFLNTLCNGTEHGCYEKIQDQKNMTKEEYQKYYDDYFVFTFVRNPYNRAASLYFMMSTKFMFDDQKNKCAPPFQVHCLDPYKLKETCNKYYKKIQTNYQSSDCCCYLKKQNRVQDFLDWHTMPQAPCIFNQNGEVLVDFIGRLEFYQEDFSYVLNEINKRNNVTDDSNDNFISIPEFVQPKGIKQQFDVDTQNSTCDYIPQMYLDVYEKFPECLKSIRKYYYLDLKMLQFSYQDQK
eukprot:TRINITY_DN826_c0_g2_i1.p1 TRINITY_DN826_c0_g2~~TRINITY_DN826_c0_g2_i1.p1  ORF type:complete len:395 (-),score=30.26 TRINITY_DN826_c0_g2_i1:593-1732(-)